MSTVDNCETPASPADVMERCTDGRLYILGDVKRHVAIYFSLAR